MEIERILESDFLARISFFNFENAITAAFYTDENLNLVNANTNFENLFKKGDTADGLYIVGKGSVGIYFPTNHTMEKPDIVLKANDILGEMGVIDTAPRMATAKALEPSVIIFVSTKEFEKKLEGSDMIVRGVMAILSERLRDLQKRR